MLVEDKVEDQKYQSILKQVRALPFRYQFRLLRDVLNMVEPEVKDESNSLSGEVTLEMLRRSVKGKDYLPPRKHAADEVAGLIKIDEASLAVEQEKEVLTQALLERYG